MIAYLRLFFLMRRRPPRSTLFPCTTLFRSRGRQDGGARIDQLDNGPAVHQPLPTARPAGPRPYRHRGGGLLRSAAKDRKSTRLNSSHANISYAVFCLKKKTMIPSTSHFLMH